MKLSVHISLQDDSGTGILVTDRYEVAIPGDVSSKDDADAVSAAMQSVMNFDDAVGRLARRVEAQADEDTGDAEAAVNAARSRMVDAAVEEAAQSENGGER